MPDSDPNAEGVEMVIVFEISPAVSDNCEYWLDRNCLQKMETKWEKPCAHKMRDVAFGEMETQTRG